MTAHIPRKRFGQNFLVAQNIIDHIINLVAPLPGQHIVEIGPGQGAITAQLIASKASIDAIEIDRDLAQILQVMFAGQKNFCLHLSDVLKFDFTTLYKTTSSKLRVVGNLPYNISTPLLFKLFADCEIISDMHFMLQKEVAERLIAKPGSKDYGRLSVMAQYYCAMQIVLAVPPSSFNPPPKVESSIVRFVPHLNPTIRVAQPKLLQQVTTQAFNQRRKTISNSLKSLISSAELQALKLDPQQRAENLDLQAYADITNYVQTKLHGKD